MYKDLSVNGDSDSCAGPHLGFGVGEQALHACVHLRYGKLCLQQHGQAQHHQPAGKHHGQQARYGSCRQLQQDDERHDDEAGQYNKDLQRDGEGGKVRGER